MFTNALFPCLSLVLVFGSLLLTPMQTQAQSSTQTLEIDMAAPTRPFPHYWERMFGSGRAVLSLRESYRRDLRELKKATGVEYVRFHAIFHDELGVYDEDADGKPVYNFSYVDQVYDGLLENGVRPFVELSFMPSKLASAQVQHPFWYKQVVAPPKSQEKWADLISHFAQHLVDRYGIEEVSEWYFEVWNEPNIDFWAGDPKEQTYYALYDTTARALKKVSPRLRIGGPATAQAAWVDRFLRHAVAENVPLDFVSTHVYGNDASQDVFGTSEEISRTEMVCRSAKKIHDQVKSSARPELPIFWTEYNVSYKTETEYTDSVFMGPWLADTIRQCDGMVDILGYWTFSDVFEEQGVVKQPFYGGYGLIAANGLPKPSFNAFKLLHKLGDRRIAVNSDSALVTRRPDGSLAIAMWNLVLPEQHGETRQIDLVIRGGEGSWAEISRLDSSHGSLHTEYAGMGKPVYPTREQIERLRRAAELPPAERRRLENGRITIPLPPNGLALIEIPQP